MSQPQRRRIFLYANQPLYRLDNSYLAPTRNFTDFVAALGALDPEWRIAVPCAERSAADLHGATLVEIPLQRAQVIETPFYDAEFKAPALSLVAAWRLARHVRAALREGLDVTVACPGPGSFLFWCSWLVPKRVRFVCFIRGDTLRTVEETYRGQVLYPAAVALTRLFRGRVRKLLRAGRAQVFAYGHAVLKQYPASPSQQFVIAPLIDERWVRSDPRPSPVVADRFRVLYVGRLAREKNVLSLIEACATAAGTESEFHLTLIGEGPERSRIEERIGTLGLAGKVTLAGLVPNGARLMQAYDEHDLLCLPSLTEGTPRVIVEAAARGVPILATRVGSIDTMFPESVRFAPGFSAADLHTAVAACKRDHSAHWEQAQKSIRRAAEFGIGYQARIVAQHLVEDW